MSMTVEASGDAGGGTQEERASSDLSGHFLVELKKMKTIM